MSATRITAISSEVWRVAFKASRDAYRSASAFRFPQCLDQSLAVSRRCTPVLALSRSQLRKSSMVSVCRCTCASMARKARTTAVVDGYREVGRKSGCGCSVGIWRI